jgi:hypothetical protein
MNDLGITPSQAHYVLSRMVSDRTISRKDVASYLAMMQREIRDLETRLDALRSLESEKGTPAARPRARRRSAGAAPKAVAKAKKRSRITPEQRASRQLQGVYMSLLRRIPKSKRAQFQALAKDKNRQAAVDAMKAVLGV